MRPRRYTADRKSRCRGAANATRETAEPDHRRRPQVRHDGASTTTSAASEIQMSKPKELNFFVEEMNRDLGLDWYAAASTTASGPRRVIPALHANLPRFEDVPERTASTARTRACSTWSATRSSGSSRTGSMPPAPATRHAEFEPTLALPNTQYINRSKYWMQLQPYLELFDREQIEMITQGGAAD